MALGVAGLRNSGQGLFGGYPGAPSLLTLIQGARVTEKHRQRPSPPIGSKISVAIVSLLPYCEFDLGQE